MGVTKFAFPRFNKLIKRRISRGVETRVVELGYEGLAEE